MCMICFFFKQKTAYEMRISDWSSDVCSSDLAIGGPHFWRSDDGNQRSSRSNKSRRPLPDIAADEIEHQIDPANVFEHVVVEIDKLLRSKLERLVPVDSASGADDVGTGLACELRHHRSDCASRTVCDDALSCPQAAVLEQSLPRSQARDRQARAQEHTSELQSLMRIS